MEHPGACVWCKQEHTHTPIRSLPQALLCLASFHQLWEKSINSPRPRPPAPHSLQILVPQPGIKPTPPAVEHRAPCPGLQGTPYPKPHCFCGETEAPGGEAGGPRSIALAGVGRGGPPEPCVSSGTVPSPGCEEVMRDLGRQEASAGALGVVMTVPVPTGQKLLDSLAETWDFFFSDVLPTLQAVFYPVQVSGRDLEVGAPPLSVGRLRLRTPPPPEMDGRQPPPQDPRKTCAMLSIPHEGGSLCVTVTPPSSEEATWGPLSSEQGSSGEESRVDGGLGVSGSVPVSWGVSVTAAAACLQGKEPSVRQLALLHFRNTITLGVKLEDALARAHARVPPAIVQMLLVLQVGGASGAGAGSLGTEPGSCPCETHQAGTLGKNLGGRGSCRGRGGGQPGTPRGAGVCGRSVPVVGPQRAPIRRGGWGPPPPTPHSNSRPSCWTFLQTTTPCGEHSTLE